MKSVIPFTLFLLFFWGSEVYSQDNSLPRNGFTKAIRNDIRIGVNFGKQFGAGAILTSTGVIVSCKHVIAGFNEGRIELSNGQQVEFNVLKEVDGKDLVFLVTKTPILGSAVPFRENASLEEGEELVCRASVAQGPLCTVRGSLAYAPRPSTSGVLVAQLPLSAGSSGTGLFDLQGSFVGVCIGPVSEKESNFIRAWSGDVIRNAIKSSFPDPWKEYVPDLGVESLTVSQYPGKLDLLSGDKIDTVNGIPMHSQLEFILTCAAFTARRETRIELGIDRNGNKAQVLIERP